MDTTMEIEKIIRNTLYRYKLKAANEPGLSTELIVNEAMNAIQALLEQSKRQAIEAERARVKKVLADNFPNKVRLDLVPGYVLAQVKLDLSLIDPNLTEMTPSDLTNQESKEV